MNNWLKLPIGKTIQAVIFYLIAINLYLFLLGTSNKEHVENSHLLAINVGMFSGCYWGVIYWLANKIQ